jgi:hypothetical protein
MSRKVAWTLVTLGVLLELYPAAKRASAQAHRRIAILGVSFITLIATAALLPLQAPSYAGSVLASAAGEACRKEICDAAVEACMRADLSLNPFARTEAEKRSYCGQFFPGCMTRSVSPDVPWYSPETVARLLKCPS